MKTAKNQSPPVSSRPRKLGLKVSSGLNMGAIYPVRKRRNIIGRRLDASFPVVDERVSRDHAVIDFKDGAYFVKDLGSTNGTYVNDEAVAKSHKLHVGDQIRVGSCIFTVELLSKKNDPEKAQWRHQTTMLHRDDIISKTPRSPKQAKLRRWNQKPRWTHLVKEHNWHPIFNLQNARILVIVLGLMFIGTALMIGF